MQFNDIISRLETKRRNDHDYRCKCPAHQGTSDDSLSISPGDNGTALLYCHAGCTYDEIVKSLGIEREALSVPASNGSGGSGKLVGRPRQQGVESKGKIVATYDYKDEDGRLLFQKVRLEPKSFRVRTPNGSGWHWSIGDTRRVLYNLPAVIAADTVMIVEGEKDADRLEKMGLVATCNFDGASKGKQSPKWDESYNPFFEGKIVYVIPDNDEPGAAHALHVAISIRPFAKDVRIVELPDLPPGGDVSDWLDSGGDVIKLMRLCQQGKPPPEPGPEPINDPLQYRCEDGGMLDAWLNRSGDNWLFAAGFEEWYKWTGTHWHVDTGYAVMAQIQRLLDQMNSRVRELRKAEKDPDQKKVLSKYVTATKRTKSRVSGIEGLARNMLFIESNRLNSARLLNVQNGTLDLETFEIRNHNSSDLLTYCLPYSYDPEAEAKAWLFFVSSLGEDVAGFLQEFAGYALTPDTHHELALWLYGPPGGGKSTLLTGLQTMLGAKAGLLGLADIERSRFALTDLPGKTLMVSAEQPGDFLSSTHVLNALISGERVKVDRKFREPIEIEPRAKIAWAMNEFPRVSDANNGIFRRVKVVKFPSVGEGDRIPQLKNIIATEGGGILNWALEGLKRLQERGRFDVPESVVRATKEFMTQNDIPANFVDECCLVGPDYKCQSSQLYKAYREWALDTGHKAQSNTSIASDWRRLGFERYRSGGKTMWSGVGLAVEEPENVEL